VQLNPLHQYDHIGGVDDHLIAARAADQGDRGVDQFLGQKDLELVLSSTAGEGPTPSFSKCPPILPLASFAWRST